MKIHQPESSSLEYKLEWSDTVKKTIIAFANGTGGLILVGAANDGEPVGCDFDRVERTVRSFCREGVTPSLEHYVEVLPQEHAGKRLAAVFVRPGPAIPYAFKGKMFGKGGIYIRLGGQTVEAHIDEVIDLIRRGNPQDWEARSCRRSDLTFRDTEAVFRKAFLPFTTYGWAGYGLKTEEGEFTNLALLLSDQSPLTTLINRYDEEGNVIECETLGGPLFSQMDKLQDRLDEVNRIRLNKDTGTIRREEISNWPAVALREALVNSFAHRDYSSPIQNAVNIHPYRIGFLTPGGIPAQLTLEEALVPGATFCRNFKLASLFVQLGLMEKAGTGFGDIFRSYAGAERQPEVKQTGRLLLLELPSQTDEMSDRDAEFVRFIAAHPHGRTRSEVEEAFGYSRPTTLKILRDLCVRDLIHTTGAARSVRYRVGPERRKQGA